MRRHLSPLNLSHLILLGLDWRQVVINQAFDLLNLKFLRRSFLHPGLWHLERSHPVIVLPGPLKGIRNRLPSWDPPSPSPPPRRQIQSFAYICLLQKIVSPYGYVPTWLCRPSSSPLWKFLAWQQIWIAGNSFCGAVLKTIAYFS